MKKLHLLCLLFLLVIVSACKKESEIETDLQPNEIENTFLLNQISGPSADEINLRTYTSSQAADFFSLDFISSSSDLARARNEVNPFLLKANEILYKNTTQEQLELLIKSIGYPAWDIGRVFGFYKDSEAEIVFVPTFESDKKTIKSIIHFEFSKEETVFVRTYDAKLYTLIHQQYPDENKAAYIKNFFDHFSNQQELAAQTRTDCGEGTCSWSDTTWGRECRQNGGPMSRAGTPCPPACCASGGEPDQGNSDLAIWFIDDISPFNPFIRFSGNSGGGGNSIDDPISQIINSSDEQALITYLMERFGWDVTHPNTISLVTYPNYMRTIAGYVGSEAQVQRFINFMNAHGNTAQLSYAELNILINLEPQERGIINIRVLDLYLKSHNDDAVSNFVLHEILRLVETNPELPSAGPSILDGFYRALTPEVTTWIQEPAKDHFRTGINDYLINGGPFEEVEERRNNLTEVINMNIDHGLNLDLGTITFLIHNTIHKDQIQVFLDNHPDDEAAREFVTEHGNALKNDQEYADFVESSFGFSPIMWSIAKELIGDKVVDLVIRFIPLGGQTQNIKDAVKAITHGDWLEVAFEVSQIVYQNTPLGQWIKAWETVDELRQFYTKLDRIWDKIGNFTEAAITRLWNIARHSPLKANANYLKYVGDLATPRLGNAPGAPALVQGTNASQFYRWQIYKGNFPEITTAQMNNMEIHHAFPQSLGWRFQNLGFTGEAIHSLENLRGIRKDIFFPAGSNVKLHTHITNTWENFLRPFENAGTSPTIQQLTNFAKNIDDQFGSFFVPPIR